MPFIMIRQFPGRTQAQKQALAERITNVVREVYGATMQPVQVLIEEVQPDTWFKDGVPASALLRMRGDQSTS